MRRRELRIGVGLVFIFLMTLLVKLPSSAGAQEPKLTPEDAKESLKTWVALCAPCHSIQGTGTDYGPPLVGPKARRFTYKQLIVMFAHPEDHGIPEAVPALSKLSPQQHSKMAAWLLSLKAPEDIVITPESGTHKPAPFIFLQNCAGCHGPDARGGIGPNLHNVSSRRSREQIINLIADPKTGGITKIMPPFEELSEAERTEIAEWLCSLKD